MVKTEIKQIGKNEALFLLGMNIKNRSITRAKVDEIKKAMNNNEFVVNGATIVIDTEGYILDGQHRLTAISEQDKSFPIIVVEGVESSAFATIDTGRTRTASDVLSIEKVPYYSVVASAIQRILNGFGSTRDSGKVGSVKKTNTEILDFYYKNKSIISEDVKFCSDLFSNKQNTKIVTPAVTTAMMFLLGLEDRRKARSFIRELYTGVKENESNASITLRTKLINYKIDGFKVSDSLMRKLFITCFRAYKENRDLSRIILTDDKSKYLFKTIEN